MSHALGPLLLSQTVTPSWTPLEHDVLYGRPLSGKGDYEFLKPLCFAYLQPVAESCTTGAHFIVTSLIFGAKKFRTLAASRY